MNEADFIDEEIMLDVYKNIKQAGYDCKIRREFSSVTIKVYLSKDIDVFFSEFLESKYLLDFTVLIDKEDDRASSLDAFLNAIQGQISVGGELYFLRKLEEFIKENY